MELMKKLRSRSLKKRIVPVLILVIAAVVLFAFSKGDLLLRKPLDLLEVPRDELEGKYVTVEVQGIYAEYAYTTKTNNDTHKTRTVSREYIIDANDYDYCGLYLPEKLLGQGEALYYASQEFLEGNSDQIYSTFTVTGIMEKMPEDSLEFYHETVDWDNMSEEDQDAFLPLYLKARTSSDTVVTWVLLILGAGLLVWAVILLVTSAAGKGQKQLMKKARELSPGNPEYILQHVDQLYSHTPSVNGLRMSESLIFVEQGSKQYLYGANELVWAYLKTEQRRVNGVPAGKTFYLVLSMLDGTTRSIAMKEETVIEQLNKISALMPGAVVGYSDELAALYKRSPAEMAASGRQLAAQRAAQTAPQE